MPVKRVRGQHGKGRAAQGVFNIVVAHVDPNVIDVPLASTREPLRERLAATVAAFEEEFGIPSAQLRDALASGAVVDTLQTCDWLIAWETLDALNSASGPTRLE